MLWSAEIKRVAKQHSGPNIVIFNLPHAIESMFYGDHVAYDYLPSEDIIDQLLADGWNVVIYDQDSLPSWVYKKEGVHLCTRHAISQEANKY